MKVWRLTRDDGSTVDLLSPDAASADKTGYGVYEALDATGEIVYTGRTGNLRNRLRQHATQSGWWAEVADVRWTPCANYAEAVGLERVSIEHDLGFANINSTIPLPSSGRMQLPAAVAARLIALYSLADTRLGNYDCDCYIATLRACGWTLQSIAQELHITREAVRLRAAKGAVDYDLVVPAPPARVGAVKAKKAWPRLSRLEVRELRELHEAAVNLRGWHEPDHPLREVSNRLTELMVEARMRGVRTREIAEACGVSAGAVIQRLKRHGYLHTAPSMTPFGTPFGRITTHCKAGHTLAGDNVRRVNGTGYRVCRACERRRTREYGERKARRAS